MNIISIEKLSKSFGLKPILEEVDLGVDINDKIGLIGLNGTGKSTFLKILSGFEEADSGNIIIKNDINIEYLSQNIDFEEKNTVLEQVFNGNSKNIQLVKRYEEAINGGNVSTEELLKLTEEMDVQNAWDLESEAKAILTELGISDFDKKVGELSGGQRKRIALASALINPSDLLILDEPTNHLDDITINWLEKHLKNRKGALIMITHDRYFLDRVTNRIIELEDGKLFSYDGNYNYFLEKKLEREEREIATERKRKSLYRQELAWMRQGAKARSTKQKARIERFNELENSAVEIKDEKLDMSLAGTRLGRKIIEIYNISKSFGDRKLIDNFSYTVLRDDRIGILGPNGMGKSTLLKMLAGKVDLDSGEIQVGETVKIGYFGQESSEMNEDQRAIDYIKEGGEYIKTLDGSSISATEMMERFLFPKDHQWAPIGKLSGGERRRLQLLRVLMESPNVLLLDEPTNDLDIDTLTVLEDYMDGFPGPVIVVSHDRYLLDKISEKVFVFEGGGKIVQYTGNYSFFRDLQEEKEKTSKEKAKQQEDKKEVDENRNKNKTLKFSFNEKREWDNILGDIEKIEEKISEVDEKMTEFASSYTKLQEFTLEKEKLESDLSEKMDRWVYLSEIAEAIDEQNK